MKAVIVDPALHSRGGHHYNAVERLQAELTRLGAEAVCLGSRSADTTTRTLLGCRPVFTNSVYGRRHFADDVATTERELAQALPHGDLLILPCCDAVLALALARHLRTRRAYDRPRVILWLLYAPDCSDQPDNAQSLVDLAETAQVRILCETEAMAEAWRGLLPTPLAATIEIAAGPGLPARPRPPGRKSAVPLVSCIGFANRAKGYRLLPDAVSLVLGQHADVRFLVHGIVRGSDAPDEQPVFDRLSTLGSRVDVRQHVLSTAEYLGILATSDLLMLPYDPEVYRVRGSGIFTDARRVGVPIVAPAACAFAAPAFADGSAVALDSWDPQGLARAILAALDRRQALAASADAAARQLDDTLGRILADGLVPSGGPSGPGVSLKQILARFRLGLDAPTKHKPGIVRRRSENDGRAPTLSSKG